MPAAADNRTLYRLREAAERLGVSVKTIYRMVASGDLVMIRKKGIPFITAESLEATAPKPAIPDARTQATIRRWQDRILADRPN